MDNADLEPLTDSRNGRAMKEKRALSGRKHAVNVWFTDAEYSSLVMEAAALTVQEGRRVSIAELVRRLVLYQNGSLQAQDHQARPPAGGDQD